MLQKKAQVHILPTKSSNITKTSIGGLLFSNYPFVASNITGQPQHLYFTTGEEIKEGEDCLQTVTNEVIKCPFDSNLETDHRYRKIVATTNPELWDVKQIDNQNYGVPKIALDFVEAYVKKQGAIKEVMLKYITEIWGIEGVDSTKLKLRNNSTVIIHPIEQKMYTRDEVIEIIAYRMADHRRSLEYHKTNKHMSTLWKQLKESAIHYLDNVYKT